MALLTVGAVEIWSLPILGLSVPLSYWVTILILAAWQITHPLTRHVARRMAAYSCLALALAAPSILKHEFDDRTLTVAQIPANAAVCVAAFGLASGLTRQQLRSSLLVAITFLSFSALAFRLRDFEPRFDNLPRPTGLFEEPTWLAIYLALLVACLLALGQLRLPALLSTLQLALLTRSALALVGAVWLARMAPGRVQRLLVVAAVAAAYVAGAVLAADQLIIQNSVVETTSIQSRALDMLAVRRASPGGIWWLGAENLVVYDHARSREIPTVSNVQLFDLYWKLGIAGLAIVGGWSIIIAHIIPRMLGARMRSNQVVLVALLMLPAVMQLNNAFGRPWLWTLIGTMWATLPRCHADPGAPIDVRPLPIESPGAQ